MFRVKNPEQKSIQLPTPNRDGSSSIDGRYSSHFFQLESGLKLSIVSFPGISTISLRCFVFVGSAYESTHNSGISHFLEHMLFRGNKKLGDAARLNVEMEKLGGELNAATSFDLTEYWYDFHKDYLKEGIEKFCHLIQYPLFEQIEVERSIILEEIKGDYNDDNRLIDLDSLSSELLWPGHPMSFPIIGNSQTIGKIKRSNLISWHEKYYCPSNIVLGITGDFETSEVVNQIDHLFQAGKVKTAPRRYRRIKSSPAGGSQLKLVFDRDNQFGFQWCFPSYHLTHELRIEYELIQRILDDGNSSRLQKLIREEKGLVYDISAETMFFEAGVTFSIQSVVGTNRLRELVSTLTDLIRNLASEGITLEELDLAKLRYRANLECAGDSAQGVLYNKLMPVLYPCGSTYEEIIPRLKAISVEKINAILGQLLGQNMTTFAIVGPCDQKTDEMLEAKLYPWINGRKSL